MEAQRDKRQAWQATSASAETAKAAIMRAEAATKEVSELRCLRKDASGRHIKRTDVSIGSALEVGQPNQRHGQSLTDVVMAAAAAADGDYGGLVKTRRSSAPAEASMLRSVSLAEEYGDRHRTVYHSPETWSSADRALPSPNEAVDRRQHKLGRSSTSAGEGFSTNSDGAPRVLPPQAAVMTEDCRAPRTIPHTVVFEGGSDSETRKKEDKGLLSSPKETQEPTANKNFSTPGSRRRMRVVETPPPAARGTGREQCYDGDKQRHDSEGVKGALTGANPAWADAPSSFGGGSSTPAVAGGRSSGGGAAGGGDFVRNIYASGRQAGDGGGLGEEARWRTEERRDHAETSSTGVDGSVVDAVGRPAQGVGSPVAGETSPTSRGWNLQGVTPHFPAAGHRRGRDMMSSRRSSLSGAGVGVSAEAAGEANVLSPIGTAGKSEDSDAIDAQYGAWNDPCGGQLLSGEGALSDGKPTSTATPVESAARDRALADHTRPAVSGGTTASEPEHRRKSTGGVRPATAYVKSTQRSESLASLLGNVGASCDSGAGERPRREKRAAAPFATDAEEDELRPVREVERRLMLLQMEASQVGSQKLVSLSPQYTVCGLCGVRVAGCAVASPHTRNVPVARISIFLFAAQLCASLSFVWVQDFSQHRCRPAPTLGGHHTFQKRCKSQLDGQEHPNNENHILAVELTVPEIATAVLCGKTHLYFGS